MIEKKDLPKWARDRLEDEAKMGNMESNASIGFSIGMLFVIALEIGAFVLGCVFIYLIGRAVVG